MLKYIKVKNFLSFKEETEINFESTNYWKLKNNVFSIWKNTFAKSMLIYGANASWKTNILKTIVVIKHFATNIDFIYDVFLLDKENKNKPSFFEINFFIDNKEYIYNFEIFWKIVKSENFYEKKWNKKIYLFIKKKQNIKFENDFKKYNKQLEDKVKEDGSVLWVLDQFNWKLNKKPVMYFFNKLHSLWDWYGNPVQTVNLLKITDSEKNKRFAIEFLKCADINICDIKVEEKKVEIMEFDILTKWTKLSYKNIIDIQFWHNIKWSEEIKYFPLSVESTWTQKLFWILWMVITTILEEWILFFDEIERGLHPHIIRKLFELIHSDLWKKYQFIFTTHNVELMSLKELKKEQIWITKKTGDNFTDFYTLYDIDELDVKDLRSENDIQKLYNLGSLGGIPSIRDFSTLVKEFKLWDNLKN